jgi:Acyltransferase family.
VERKKIVPELIIVRAIACLTVVLMHSITLTLGGAEAGPGLTAVRTLVLFSTPVFAFMSAFLIGYSKRKRTYGETIWLRVKYLLTPYLVFAAFYAAWQAYNWHVPFLPRLSYNIRGGYHGYFVLVVMQFYLVHPLMKPLMDRFGPKVMLTAAGVVNFLYLAALNLGWVSLPYLGFNWYHLLPAWVFYYVLGYYSGRDRDAFQAWLGRYWPGAVLLLLASAATAVYFTETGFLPLTSQRFDIFVYAVAVILVGFWITGRFQRVPALLNHVNRASYGIYLLHWFFLELFLRVARPFFSLPREVIILALWMAAALAAGLVTYALNRFRWGAFVVGRLGVDGRARPAPAREPGAAELAAATAPHGRQ